MTVLVIVYLVAGLAVGAAWWHYATSRTVTEAIGDEVPEMRVRPDAGTVYYVSIAAVTVAVVALWPAFAVWVTWVVFKQR